MPPTPPSSTATIWPDADSTAESPRSARRKRTFDQLYPSTSATQSTANRPNTAPETSQRRQAEPDMTEWERHGFGRSITEAPETPNKSAVPSTSSSQSSSADTASLNKQEPEDAMEDLQDYNWDDLEARYSEAMDVRSAVEAKIFEEFGGLMEVSRDLALGLLHMAHRLKFAQVFSAWAQTTSGHENDRAIKR